MKINGRINSSVTFKGNGTCPIYIKNGQKVPNNTIENLNYYLNVKIYAKSTIKGILHINYIMDSIRW